MGTGEKAGTGVSDPQEWLVKWRKGHGRPYLRVENASQHTDDAWADRQRDAVRFTSLAVAHKNAATWPGYARVVRLKGRRRVDLEALAARMDAERASAKTEAAAADVAGRFDNFASLRTVAATWEKAARMVREAATKDHTP